jgi:hypothetical protein
MIPMRVPMAISFTIENDSNHFDALERAPHLLLWRAFIGVEAGNVCFQGSRDLIDRL